MINNIKSLSDRSIVRSKHNIIDCVVGARPNFMKIAPVLEILSKESGVNTRLVHTGQHFDRSMNDVFFEELNLPAPDIQLGVNSGTHTAQTANIMLRLEKAFSEHRPDLIVVVGDVNSTVAAALVASKLTIPLAHIEAGLRSRDRTMPEEINRLVTDSLSDIHFTTEPSAGQNLISEGTTSDRIHFVGNVMIDTLLSCLGRARDPVETFREVGVSQSFSEAVKSGFAFVTLHRPSNVDNPRQLSALADALKVVSRRIPLLFAVHPRTRKTLAALNHPIELNSDRIKITPPLSYLQTLGLQRSARLVITDSGGLQEETTALGTPCLTLRKSTERPITVEIGTNIVVGDDASELPAAVEASLRNPKRGQMPELWDGRASERIANAILAFLSKGYRAAA
ncbi:MAG: UDP-N-acetylglucosamine 2-epimerase (non-hydrolyzing) [Pseudomonadota bacterium]